MAIYTDYRAYAATYGPEASPFDCWQCSQCGIVKTRAPADAFTGGYGIGADGRQMFCYCCCAENDKEQMRRTGRACLYLNAKTREVTNWPGSLRLRCGPARKSWHNFAGRNGRTDVWFTFEGDTWHGVNIGDNDILRCKRTKGN